LAFGLWPLAFGLWSWVFGFFDSWVLNAGDHITASTHPPLKEDQLERTNFENLQIYKLSEKLSDQLWKIVVRWDVLARDTVGKQLVRAVDSIGANIAEGSGRGTDPELRRFLRMARGSLYETQHWLRRAYRRRLLNEKEVSDLLPLVKELTPKLNAYLGSIGKLGKRRSSPGKLT
jgi:four helix bundle protein